MSSSLYTAAVDVAISELRANLKHFVDRARAGDRITVTDRGLPVARLGPPEEDGVLDRLERAGVLTRAQASGRPIARTASRITADGPIADLVGEMRAEA